ncbi:MAG: formyltransferase family protein [Patescibacteria group bacterium]|jgi:methionyl-tRNA formyltransferase
MRICVLGHGSRYDAVKEALGNAGHELMRSMNPAIIDLIVLANYSTILKKEDYQYVKYGAINCHAGNLPEYRGSSVLNWQIINGEQFFGLSIIQVDEGIDTGDILWKHSYAMSDKTISDIREIANREFAREILIIVSMIEYGTIKKVKQGENSAYYWHHRKPADSRILWDKMTAGQVYNLVRASEPPYEAFCWLGDYIDKEKDSLFIPRAKLLDETFKGIAGRVVRKIDDGVVVIAKDRGVWIRADLKVGDQLW